MDRTTPRAYDDTTMGATTDMNTEMNTTSRISAFHNLTARITDRITNRMTSSMIRRTATVGLGVAMMAGIATPVLAATSTATAAAKPAAVSVSANELTAAAGHSASTDAINTLTGTTATAKAAAAPKTAAKPATKPAAKAAPSDAALLPHGHARHGQVSTPTGAAQMANVKAIVKASKEMHLPPRAAVIAVATSLQESKLKNYGNLGNRNDHDSLGLFQQRPSCGWGTPSQIVNPDHAAKAFLSRLVQVHNWKTLPLTVAAQKVQVSAFGDRYAQWENQAANLVKAVYNAA